MSRIECLTQLGRLISEHEISDPTMRSAFRTAATQMFLSGKSWRAIYPQLTSGELPTSKLADVLNAIEAFRKEHQDIIDEVHAD